jgi:hypothetical protein
MAGVMYLVYVNVDNSVVWSDSGKVHKAGRVPLGEKLEVIDLVSGWYEVNRPEHISLPVQPLYPRYFIDPAVCQNEPIGGVIEPPVEPEPVGEIDAAEALIFVKALRYIFGG